MLKLYKRKNTCYNLMFLLFLTICCTACNKKDQKPEEPKIDSYAYEVNCTSCEITYLDKSKTLKTISNNNGKWSYSFGKANNPELKIKIKTTSNVYPSIGAYVLLNDEVVYGYMGYNTFELSYDVKTGLKSMTYGNYSGGSTPGNSGSGSGSAGGGTKPTSSVCGARTKNGGSCKRVVAGGGRCWQHN